MTENNMIFTSLLDWAALAWFFVLWIGYTILARTFATRVVSLSNLLYKYRLDWMENSLRRESRITDVSLLDTIQKMPNFLATTSIFAIAGLIAAIPSAKRVQELLQDHPFIVSPTEEQVQFKIAVLGLIFVFAFFRLTWAMRQHTFLLLLLGSVPQIKGNEQLTNEQAQVVRYVTNIADRASHDFNYGLRAYYFALAFLAWFVNPWFFMAATVLVIYGLYRREFRSPSLKYMALTHDAIHAIK